MRETRKIDQRPMPKVKGIDLEHALNYIDLKDVSLDFIYDKHTGVRLPYTWGSRPILEALIQDIICESDDEFDIIKALAAYVVENVRWAGFYHKEYNKPLPSARGLDEEELIASKFAWCNEQARILCSLTQLVKIPSRMVFASNSAQTGEHVLTEVLTSRGWLLIDQSLGFLFMREAEAICAYDVFHNSSNHSYFSPIYKEFCAKLIDGLGIDIIKEDFAMATLDDPLTGFECLGFYNYFIL